MAPRAAILILSAALLAATPARAQFQPFAMKLPGWPRAELVPGHWSDAAGTSSGMDLLIVQASGATVGARTTYRNLLPPFIADPYAAPAAVRAGALAAFDGTSNGRVPDAAWGETTGISVAWGTSPGALAAFTNLFAYYVDGLSAARMLPRAQPVLIAAAGIPDFHGVGVYGKVYAVDLAASKSPPTAPATRAWDVPTSDRAQDGDLLDRAHPLRLSPAARSGGIDDVLVPLSKGFFLLWHRSVPASASLGALDVAPLSFGVTSGGDLTPFLPAPLDTTFNYGSCFGGAVMDVDGDPYPDLVFSYAYEPIGTVAPAGALLWIRGAADGATMVAQRPWGSLAGRPDLPLVNAGVLRQIDLGTGVSAFAVADRTLETIFVVRGNGVTGFDVTALPAPGVIVRDIVAADVVGAPAKDLVVLVDFPVGHPGYPGSEVWVYPDDDDLATTLAWRPRLPAAAPLGVDLPLGVTAIDPDVPPTPVTVSWLWPLSPETTAAPNTTAWTVPGASLCGVTSLDFKVRALDTLGVYTELKGSVPVVGRPDLRLAGSAASGPLVLAPGGVSARAEGVAWPGCATGTPTYTWGQILLGGWVETHQPALSATAWIDFTLPEAAYPEALSGDPALTLGATGPTAAGTVTGSATVPLSLDARGLVGVTVAFDQGALAPGDLGLARVRLTNRIGVPLPAVRGLVRLDGLAFGGPMEVEGARASPGTPDGVFVVASLPAAPAVVEVQVPVRSLGAPGGISVELFSQGGHRLSYEATPPAERAITPGCGCGAAGGGGGSALLLLLLAAYMKPMRRVLARTRSTSSSTRISRQA